VTWNVPSISLYVILCVRVTSSMCDSVHCMMIISSMSCAMCLVCYILTYDQFCMWMFDHEHIRVTDCYVMCELSTVTCSTVIMTGKIMD
jgi:hypothetical protein